MCFIATRLKCDIFSEFTVNRFRFVSVSHSEILLFLHANYSFMERLQSFEAEDWAPNQVCADI